MLQSDLPKLFKKQPTNYSYTLKRLLALGLIVKVPIKMRGSKGATSSLNTSLLRHVTFADAPFAAHDKVRVLSSGWSVSRSARLQGVRAV